MLLHEKAEKAKLHVQSKLRKKRHAHDKKSTALEAEERSMRTVMELEEQLRAEHESLLLLDQQRRDQINALVGQLEILGVEPAVHLDDSPPARPNPPPSLASTRRSLDIPRPRPPRKHEHEHDPSAADMPRVVVVRAARRPSAASTGEEDGAEEGEGSGASGSEDEYTDGEEEEEDEEDYGSENSSGSGSGSASEENETGSPRRGSAEDSPKRRTAARTRSPRLAAAEARGNEALQMRLHEMECAMEEQDSRHEQELEQLTAQLDDAKALVSQYQSLLGESEDALQRAETAVGLQSAIAAKPQHTVLSANERRAVAHNAQVQSALTGLLAAIEAANVQNSGPTLHRFHALLRGIADDVAQHSTATDGSN